MDSSKSNPSWEMVKGGASAGLGTTNCGPIRCWTSRPRKLSEFRFRSFTGSRLKAHCHLKGSGRMPHAPGSISQWMKALPTAFCKPSAGLCASGKNWHFPTRPLRHGAALSARPTSPRLSGYAPTSNGETSTNSICVGNSGAFCPPHSHRLMPSPTWCARPTRPIRPTLVPSRQAGAVRQPGVLP